MATAEDGSTPPFWPWTHAYVINLERRPDRLRSVREWSAQLGVSIERVAAVDGAAAEPAPTVLDPLWDPTPSLQWHRGAAASAARAGAPRAALRMTPGEVGCALSHVALWRRIAALGGDARARAHGVLVLEDDARPRFSRRGPPGFAAALGALWPRVPPASEIVYLGLCDRGRRRARGLPAGVFAPTYGWCTHAMVVWPAAAARLLERLPVRGPVDTWLADHKWFGLAVYALVQPPGGDDGAAAAAAPWDGRGAYLFSQAGKFRADSDVASSLRVRVKEERREERDGRDSAESAPCRNKETAA